VVVWSLSLFSAGAVSGVAQAYYARETGNLEAALSARRAEPHLLADPRQVQLFLKEARLGSVRLLKSAAHFASRRSRAQSRALDSGAALAQLASQAEFFAGGQGSSTQRAA
jgi:hypothetical protein